MCCEIIVRTQALGGQEGAERSSMEVVKERMEEKGAEEAREVDAVLMLVMAEEEVTQHQ